VFTGLIEEVGTVEEIFQRDENRHITITSSDLVKQLKPGDSISVSGVCLTALDISERSFSADLAAETWARTSFSRIKTKSTVNLELPMRADGRFGGHIVQGHVDGTGTLISLKRNAGAEDYWLTIEVPNELLRYIVPKGSLSIEGISLTVAKLEANIVSVAIIPHTVEVTNLKNLKNGDPLNLEVDVIAKYVERLMSTKSPSSITLQSLKEQGF
jgi:riboflavin synthase